MFGSICSVDGCSDPVGGWPLGGMCRFHDIVASARNLSPEAFDRLRVTLADTPPLTDEERRLRRVAAALGTLQWTARDFKRAKKAARQAGATKGQLADAVNALARDGRRRSK